MIFLRFLTLVLGLSLLSQVVAVEKSASPSPNDGGLWSLMQTYADASAYSPSLSVHNQQTRRIINLPVNAFGTPIGWSRDGQWLLYTDDRECDHGGCFPQGNLMRIHLTGRDNSQIGSLDIGDALLRSNLGRWYAHLNQDQDLVLYREDGRVTRHLTRLPSDGGFYSRLQWSPDDEWLYIGLSFNLHEANNPSLEIFRIRPDSTTPESIIRLDDMYGENMLILDDSILFTATDLAYEHAWLYQSDLDGANVEQLFEIHTRETQWDFWIASSGKIFAYYPYSDYPVFEFVPEESEPRVVVANSDGQALYLSNWLPSQSNGPRNHLQRSPSGHYFTGRFTDTLGYVSWIVLSEEGEIIINLPNEIGMFSSAFWVDDVAYVTRTTNDNIELLAYHEGDDDYAVMREFPEDAYDVMLLNTDQHHWYWYSMNGTRYVTNLDGSATYQMSPDITLYGSYGWVEVPFQERKLHWLVVLGTACFGVTLIPNRLIRRR